MLRIENYPNVYKETCIILNNMEIKNVNMISNTIIEVLKNNMNPNYTF